MRAIVLREVGAVELAARPEPRLVGDGDAVVRVTTAAICGSDIHIVEGRDAGVRPGTILGHEFVGIVEELSPGVTSVAVGDRVLAPFTVNCGDCFYCRRGLTARCVRSAPFGFVTAAGEGLEGAQAERVRVPLAGSTLLRIPGGSGRESAAAAGVAERERAARLAGFKVSASAADSARPASPAPSAGIAGGESAAACERAAGGVGTEVADEEVLFLGDVFSTAYSCAEAAGFGIGDTVLVVGCGPIGLLCVIAARWLGAGAVVAIDSVEYRLEKAAQLGALPLDLRRLGPAGAMPPLLAELTAGRGADAVLEAVGSAAALDLAIGAVRPGGVVSIAGYHTDAVYPLRIHAAYGKNLTLRIGRCSARAVMERLLPRVLAEPLPLTEIVSHTLPLSDGPRGYELFRRREDSAIKVLLKPGGS
jgi:threonine dehydrogenase-like Zn-dependent dehydrogenase